MEKFKLDRKYIVMSLSIFAFMIMGSVNVSAQQWVSSDEAALLVKDYVIDLEVDFSNANTTQEKLDIAFEIKYFNTVHHLFTDGGMEVSQAVSEARPENKPMAHSSGLIYFDTTDPNFKVQSEAFIASATDLLSN